MAEEEMSESLVSRRSKRSTAGNRMQAALAEMALEEQTKDPDDDRDFIVEKFEEDAFESDFESTDEEAAREDGEREVQDSEKKARKVAKTRLERATAAAHERQKVTFDPTAHVPSTSKPKKPKRRVSLGLAINAETGEVIQDDTTRKSKRGSTRLNTTETVKRMIQSEEKKAQAPKKTKTKNRALTQGELIARALDNEEGNLVEHRDYLMLEEEKRKRARVVRESVTGPLIRWVSRIEETKIKEVVQPPPPPQLPSYLYGYASQLAEMYTQTSPGSGTSTTPYPQYGYQYYNYQSGVTSGVTAPSFQATSTSHTPAASTSTLPASSQATTSVQSSQTPAAAVIQPTQAPEESTLSALVPTSNSTSASQPLQVEAQASTSASAISSTSTPTITPATPTPSTAATASTTTYNPYLTYSITSQLLASLQQKQQQQQQEQMQEIERTENVMKNYVVHELGQYDEAPKPGWKDTMEAMFGDHVNWEEVKAYTGRVRPLGRPTRICPITGLPAKYLDPRTGVPYADIQAYKTLSALLQHQYDWSPELGCYVGKLENERGHSDAIDTS